MPLGFCPRCGSMLPERSTFCGVCGQQLFATAQPMGPMATAAQLPSLALTIIITFFFGLFGLIPAAVHSGRAKQMGASGGRYWGAFFITLISATIIGTITAVLFYGAIFAAMFTTDTSYSDPYISSPYGSVQDAEEPVPQENQPPMTSGDIPADATWCTDYLAVNAAASCEFADNVNYAYIESSGGDVTLRGVYSPVTAKYYDMRCVVTSIVTCTGGNNAVVYMM